MTDDILMGDITERYRSGRNGVDSKSICPVNSGARGFESHPLRQPSFETKKKVKLFSSSTNIEIVLKKIPLSFSYCA